jgi:predicted O-methyltransferase YrrM
VGRFTTDWFTPNIPVWSAILGKNFSPDQELKILEIGAWEGMSTTYLAQEFPKALITSVDTWVGSDEHTEVDMIEVEALFDNNVKKFDGRVLKHKSTSRNYFANLPDGEQFDLVYIDGSHHSRDVILDAIQGFAHLKVNGIMIFDDYLWRFYPAIFHNAAAALHLFIKLHSFELNLLRASYQLIVQKSSP